MEKVISEWRIVETDDGFRIEIKGDKQAMQHWIEHIKMHGPMRMGRHMGFGPWGFRGRHGPWSCWGEEGDEPAKEKQD